MMAWSLAAARTMEAPPTRRENVPTILLASDMANGGRFFRGWWNAWPVYTLQTTRPALT